MSKVKEKFLEIADKVNYSHWGNKKLFEKKIEVLGKNFQILNERAYNTSIAFRTTYGTIIGGTIAFIGLFSKNGIPESILYKLILFIVLGIIWLLYSYLLDYFALIISMDYINKKQKVFIEYKVKIDKRNYGKEDNDKANKDAKFVLPGNHIFSKILYFISYMILFLSIGILIYSLFEILYNIEQFSTAINEIKN